MMDTCSGNRGFAIGWFLAVLALILAAFGPSATEAAERQELSRGQLGVKVQVVTPEIAAEMGIPGAEGLVVREVLAGSPAMAAGIRPGDVIAGVNRQRVHVTEELIAALQHRAEGQDTVLDIIREGRVGYVVVPASPPSGHSETLQPGTYRCSSYNVSGGGGSCRNVPSLILAPDGTYQYSSTQGRWRVQGGKLLLSETTLWGTGEILGTETVRFAYDYRGWRHVVTWVCQACGYAASKGDSSPSSSGSRPKGSYVVVSLTLQFRNPISGVSSFVIVPAESARTYTHNGPLPQGAVQGLAWETGPTTVQLATGRNDKLISGRKYAVFLSWPRETIPVAVLDLPPVDSDFTGTLPAALP